jgi:hypothetical protein
MYRESYVAEFKLSQQPFDAAESWEDYSEIINSIVLCVSL